MLTLEQSITVEPLDCALLRLDELIAAVNTDAELLTPTEARAIWHELDAVARSLKRAAYSRPSRRSDIAATPTPSQGDLVV